MSGYNLPWKSGNSGLYLKILTRDAWLVWYYQGFLVGLVKISHLKSVVSLFLPDLFLVIWFNLNLKCLVSLVDNDKS